MKYVLNTWYECDKHSILDMYCTSMEVAHFHGDFPMWLLPSKTTSCLHGEFPGRLNLLPRKPLRTSIEVSVYFHLLLPPNVCFPGIFFHVLLSVFSLELAHIYFFLLDVEASTLKYQICTMEDQTHIEHTCLGFKTVVLVRSNASFKF